MNDFEKIFLSWRKGSGSGRHIVGVIGKTLTGNFYFEYLKEEIENAKDEGFNLYAGFPDVNLRYENNVLEVFSQRLIRSERQDIHYFYDFWEIEPKYENDKFYLLGHTQGLLPIDNFEFLADYEPIPGLHFLTDLAGLSHHSIPSAIVQVGDKLDWRLDVDNSFDQEAVSVYKDEVFVGHIKKVHCKVFHKPGGDLLRLKVKAFERNGKLKKLFVKVYNPQQA